MNRIAPTLAELRRLLATGLSKELHPVLKVPAAFPASTTAASLSKTTAPQVPELDVKLERLLTIREQTNPTRSSLYTSGWPQLLPAEGGRFKI